MQNILQVNCMKRCRIESEVETWCVERIRNTESILVYGEQFCNNGEALMVLIDIEKRKKFVTTDLPTPSKASVTMILLWKKMISYNCQLVCDVHKSGTISHINQVPNQQHLTPRFLIFPVPYAPKISCSLRTLLS